MFDPLTLKRIKSQQIFEQSEGGVSQIKLEPTQMILVSSRKGTLKAISIVR